MNLYELAKEDFLFAYKWAKKQKYIWGAKDNKALGMLIKQMRTYHDNKLDTSGMRAALRLFYNKSFCTAPEWIKKSITMTLINSQFNVIMASDEIEQKKPVKKGFYNPHKHEIEPPMRPGGMQSLPELINSLQIPKSDI